MGTPQDLVENPEHKFVGYFIGSPGMNFLRCTLDANAVLVNGAKILLDQKTVELAHEARGALELGIRPIHLELFSKPVDNSVPVRVEAVDDLNSYKLVKLNFADNTLHAKLPEGAPVPSGNAWLVFPPTKATSAPADATAVGKVISTSRLIPTAYSSSRCGERVTIGSLFRPMAASQAIPVPAIAMIQL